MEVRELDEPVKPKQQEGCHKDNGHMTTLSHHSMYCLDDFVEQQGGKVMKIHQELRTGHGGRFHGAIVQDVRVIVPRLVHYLLFRAVSGITVV